MPATSVSNAGPSVSVNPDLRKELLAAVWYTCSKIVEEEEVELGVIASEAFVASLAEMVYAQIEVLGLDLQAFAKHAKRTSVIGEDVMLVCRKNPQLLKRMENLHASLIKK